MTSLPVTDKLSTKNSNCKEDLNNANKNIDCAFRYNQKVKHHLIRFFKRTN